MMLVRILTLVTILSWTAFGATFGTTVPLLGEFSDMALDEGRGLLYIANFTANRIEVFSTASQGLQPPIKLGINPSALALAPDGKTLMVLNFCSASLFMVNLDNRSIQTVSLPGFPRAGEFGSDGVALLLVSPVDPCQNRLPQKDALVIRYDPASGEIAQLASLSKTLGTLPVPQPNFPSEIVNARMAVSQDRNTILVVGSFDINVHFSFYYSVPSRALVTAGCSRLITSPVRFASVAPDGRRFMSGGLLRDRQLHILADFVPSTELPIKVAPAVPTAPPPNTPAPAPERVIGATAFSRDGNVIYASFVDLPVSGAPPFLYLLDSDNLTIRDRILLSDRLTGKMISNSAGTRLYALSDSGLTILPISDLDRAPRLTASSDVVSFKFNVCSKLSTAVTFNVANRGSGSMPFQVSSDMPGVQLSPTAGTTPATVTVTFDPDKLFNVKGTTLGLINISSPDAVNIPNPVQVLVNLQDSDQRGTIFVQSGILRDLIVDEARQRFYILDSAGTSNRLLVFDLNDFSLRATVRTGYFPLNMTIALDRRTLLVTNAQSETISRINLDTLQQEGFVFCPCSSYPRSVAVSSNAILATAAVDRGRILRTADNQQVEVIVTQGRMNRVDLANNVANELATIGIFENNISPKTLLTATPNGSRILIAEDTNTSGATAGALAKIYEADSDTFVLARAISTKPLKGGVAATDSGMYSAGAVLMGSSLTPLAEFSDAPNEHNGLVFVGNQIVRTLKPATTGGPGIASRVDPTTLRSLNPVKLAEAPLAFLDDQPLRRSLAATRDGGKFVTLSSSGFMIIPGTFDAFIPPPVVRSVTNSASLAPPVAPGALISVFGDNLAPLSTRAGAVPLPTFLADSCITVNNLPVPLLFLSPGQINGQIPFEITGSATMVVHAPGGVSEPFSFDVPGAAPALFQSSFGGQAPRPIPLVFRAVNGEPVTVSNPARQDEVLFMFANGLGRVTPAVASGDAPPPGPLFQTVLTPTVTIGGRPAEVLFSGLAPGFVGLNQLNIRVPLDAPIGFDIPMKIAAAGNAADVTLARVLPALEK